MVSMINIHDPIACWLTTKDAARQGLEWTDLQRHALTARRIDGGIAMTFDAELADRVEDLAALEKVMLRLPVYCDVAFQR